MRIKVATLLKEQGKEKTLKFLNDYLKNFLMMTKTHFEYAELLRKAKNLIEEGKLNEIEELDKKLEELEDYDFWD